MLFWSRETDDLDIDIGEFSPLRASFDFATAVNYHIMKLSTIAELSADLCIAKQKNDYRYNMP